MHFLVHKAETPRRYHNLDRLTLISQTHSGYMMKIDMPIHEFPVKIGTILDITFNEINDQKKRDHIVFSTTLLCVTDTETTYSASGLLIIMCGFSLVNLLADSNCVADMVHDDNNDVDFVISRVE